jgi:hypothetical protein
VRGQVQRTQLPLQVGDFGGQLPHFVCVGVLFAKEGIEFIFAGEELFAQRLCFRMHVVEQGARGCELVGRQPELVGDVQDVPLRRARNEMMLLDILLALFLTHVGNLTTVKSNQRICIHFSEGCSESTGDLASVRTMEHR